MVADGLITFSEHLAENRFSTNQTQKPSKATAKPMNIALTLFNSLEEDGRVLNAKLTMSFGAGRVIDPIRFEQAQETAPSEVELEVRFS